jgi:hypothetical protein
MLFAQLSSDPDYCFCADTGCVGEELAEVIVVSSLELVLDDYVVAGPDLLCEDIGFESANASLDGRELELDFDCFPRGAVGCLAERAKV